MSSSSVVPVVLWGNHPPSHCISCITTTYDQKTIVTGSSDGQLGIWDLRFHANGEVNVVPRNLIFAHDAKVTALAKAADGWDNKSSIISAAENGELCLWDTDDGLCIQTNVISGTHSALHSFHVATNNGKEWRLVCHGSYSDVYVIDATSLEILYVLKSPSHSNWISAVCVVRPARRQEDVVVAISLSGYLAIWALKPAIDSKYAEPAYEQELRELTGCTTHSICCNPFTQRTILVISSNNWLLYDASDFKFLTSVPCPPNMLWGGGDFIAADCLIVWTKDGSSYVYKLPRMCCPGLQEAAKGNPYQEPTVIHKLALPEVPQSPGDCNDPAMFFSYGRRDPFYKMVMRGCSNGSVCIWKVKDEILETIKPVEDASPLLQSRISDCWDEFSRPCGLIDSLNGKDEGISVTTSLYIPSQGRIVCGRQDGSIVIISAARAAIAQLLRSRSTEGPVWPSHRVLIGHHGRVTCLLYPRDEYPRYDKHLLVSGGVDFTVKLWDIYTGDLLSTYNPHGGEVLRLICTPPDCSTRIQSCVCSVADDHSVALLGIRERKCVMVAAIHTFPVETIKWRALDDFLVVGCSDGSVYVWQMETGHLDRYVTGQVALDILAACDDEENGALSTTNVPSKSKVAAIGKKLSHFTSNLPANAATAAVKKLKRTSGSPSSASSSPSPTPKRPDVSKGEAPAEQVIPLKVLSTKAADADAEIHVLMFDTEAVICHLMREENPAMKKKNDSKRKPPVPKPPVISGGGRRYSGSEKSADHYHRGSSGDETHDVAQLMISSLHSWGLDASMDDVCTERLGLLKPVKPVSFGLQTRGGRLSLMLPGWFGEESERSGEESHGEPTVSRILPSILAEEVARKRRRSSNHSDATCFHSRWQLSSALTTLHMVGLVSVANTLMSMNQVSFIPSEKRLALLTNASREVPRSSSSYDDGGDGPVPSDSDIQMAMNHRAHIKAGWSQLAALHCCLLADLLTVPVYKPPLLHILARRWQDRCLEIREAAQAILLAELRRIGFEGRKKVVETWAPQLPRRLSDPNVGTGSGSEALTDASPTPTNNVVGSASDRRESADDEVIFPIDDISTVVSSVKKLLQYDQRRRQATAIVLMGVIGAEFQREVDVYETREGGGGGNTPVKSANSVSEMIMDFNTVRHTGKALMYLLLKQPSSRQTANTSVRRAAIDLIGRGFTLWEPYMDVSSVLLALLELSADDKAHDMSFPKGLPLSPAADTHRSARHALSLIATARPSVFIATIAKEVARSIAAVSSISFNQPSPSAIAVYSHVRHQPTQNTEAQTTTVLNRAKKEILRIIDLMIEKTQQDVVDLLTDVVDVVVYCLDQKSIKEKGLTELFPGLCRFNMVSYSHQSRRLAVGAKSGQVALYDLRSSRCQMVSAHSSPVTALSFSPDDKALASYSFGDSKICFWQTGSSLFGMLSSSMKCVKSYTTPRPTSKISPSLLKMVRLVWINHKHVILLMADGAEFKYSI
ncbi:WD repeat-containing protein 7 [Nematostella vectensis]|uniref:WD repeat-containing protein 7 n=1 Tax=Nematostella vectensis TaxID=45351 RepID=UPI0020771D44|nr:WD repeat-containing protein 7 [Nematostella vectensis]